MEATGMGEQNLNIYVVLYVKWESEGMRNESKRWKKMLQKLEKTVVLYVVLS